MDLFENPPSRSNLKADEDPDEEHPIWSSIAGFPVSGSGSACRGDAARFWAPFSFSYSSLVLFC